MAESTEAKSDKYAARLTQAVEHLRGNVKWTLLAFGAIGTTLLAGSQLSNLGKFGYDEPRLWFALGCALLAMAASAYAVASALAVAYSGYTELYSLDEADIAYVQHNKALLEGFASVDALRREYEKATEKRHRHLMNPETDAGELADDKIWYFYLDGLVDKVLSYIRYNRIQRQVDRSRTQLTIASMVAALALIGFAWAANPSAEQPALVLRSPASQAKLTLSASGKATLTPVLGAECAARATIDVIVLNVTTSGSEVVTLASKDCPVARFTLTSGMGKLASDGNAAGAAAPMPGPTAAAEPIVWTQLRPDRTGAKGQLIARAIVGREQACPQATVDGASRRIEARADGSDPDFPIKLCETAIPGDAKAAIGTVALKPRPTQPRKIVVIGDTGCRITDYAAQACDRASDWPFFRVAAAAAKLQPDLIIHVGDYHYRENPCAGRPACDGSPYGDNWATWKADFFTPAGALLAAAPWLMVRGNHEDCTRAGAGWNLLVRPDLGMTPGERCPPDTDPYVLAFTGLRLVVLDSASVEVYRRDKRVLTYRKQLRTHNKDLAAPLAPGEQAWLLLHHPLWASSGSRQGDVYTETDLYSSVSGALAGAARDEVCQQIIDPVDTFRTWTTHGLPAENPVGTGDEQPCAKLEPPKDPLPSPAFAMVLSGHVHNFQMFVPADGKQPVGKQPVQVVVGNSGDDRETGEGFSKAIEKLDIQRADLFGVEGTLSMRNTFGFTVLEKLDDASAWIATLYDADGRIIGRCTIAPSGTCSQPQP